MEIKANDIVRVNSGKDKGKMGKVLKVFSRRGLILVEGVNMMVKNVRARRQGEKGQVVKYNSPINLSNVQLFCSKCNRAVRYGISQNSSGKKSRVCRRCGQEL